MKYSCKFNVFKPYLTDDSHNKNDLHHDDRGGCVSLDSLPGRHGATGRQVSEALFCFLLQASVARPVDLEAGWRSSLAAARS